VTGRRFVDASIMVVVFVQTNAGLPMLVWFVRWKVTQPSNTTPRLLHSTGMLRLVVSQSPGQMAMIQKTFHA